MNWPLVPLKQLGRWLSGGTPPKDDDDAWAGDVPWISAKDFDNDHLRTPVSFITSEAAARHSKVVEPGTLLMIVRGMALLHGLSIIKVERAVAFNQDLWALVPRRCHSSAFLRYSMLGHRWALAAHIDKAAHGTARVTESVRSERIQVPEFATQTSVVELLDRECSRIAQLDRAAAMSIDLFEEYRDSALTYAIAELTGHDVAFGRILLRAEQGWSPQCEDRIPGPGEWGVLKAGAVNGGVFHQDRVKALPADIEPRRAMQLRDGDVLMCRASGSLELIGSSALIERAPERTLICDKLYRLTVEPHACLPAVAPLLMRLPAVREQIKRSVSGGEGMANNIPLRAIRQLRVPMVPLEAQPELVRKAESLNRSRSACEHSTRRLRARLAEYREALIFEAVTGRIDATKVSDAQMDERTHAAMEGAVPA